MSQDASSLPAQQPEICPVASIRVPPGQTPNRSLTKQEYHHHGSLKFDEGEVKCLSHKRSGTLLFVMPDGSGFKIDTAIAANQAYKYWKKTSLAADPTPIEADLAELLPGAIES